MSTMNTAQAAQYIGRAVKTMQRFDREGILRPSGRTPTNRRVYTVDQLNQFLGQKKEVCVPTRVVVYCRVSSAAQRPDLKNQRNVLEQFCASRGLSNPEFIEEVGGGLNFKRKRFLEVFDAIGQNQIKILIVAHKDRLCRFGLAWFERFMKQHGCEFLVLNQETLSPEEEMVQDLMTIIHCFSSRLYGLRNYRKTLKKALAIK